MNPTTLKVRSPGRHFPGARFFALALALATIFSTMACGQISLPRASAPDMETRSDLSSEDLALEAANFFAAGNFPLAEMQYSRLLERADLSRADRLKALDRLAISAYKAKHYHQAKQALDLRAGADTTVLGAWPWHELYFNTLVELGRTDLLDTHQAWILAHTELPFEVRSRAVLSFAQIYAKRADYARSLNILAEFHRKAPDAAAKKSIEQRTAAALRELPDDQLAGLAQASGPPSKFFPQLLIQREAARRAQAPRQSALPARTQLSQGNASHVALLLPLTGRFAATGQKVLRGAEAAQKRLATQGRPVTVKVVNVEAPDWREQLAALPANVAVVGGPLLNTEALRSLEGSGALAKRAVFTFQPDLGTIQEGRQAWRFYPSMQDQARALMDLTANKMGIRSVAVLAPKNRYGQRMAEVFQAEAKARGVRVAATETYPPDDHPRWLQSVSHLLKIPEGFRRNKNTPLPMPDFGAVFMPEDWTQAEMLASNFYFFEGQHLLFLGPDLWSVGLDNAKDVDDSYFQHAACPGAWWPETEGGRALQAVLDEQSLGQADFWVALGYDFIRLSTQLGLAEGWTPTEVNQRLAALSEQKGMAYSMAPVVWNAAGQARQNLYLFTPRKEGKALVDATEMRESIEKAKSRREKRLVSSREIRKAKKDSASGSLTKDVQD